jgi:DNA modification methylase
MNWLDEVHVGDCRTLMKQMITDGVKVNCVVTSPPYWGLRDYGAEGQFGLERTWIRHVARMRGVFRLVREVLADDGVLWLNYGDSYCGSPGGGQGKNGQRRSRTFTARIDLPKRGGGLKPKDKAGIPWRVAFALQEDGWWLRSDCIWNKANPMPESIVDRPTTAHEFVFLFAKNGSNPLLYRARDTGEWSKTPNLEEMIETTDSQGEPVTIPRWRGFDYYYDQDAVREAASENTHRRLAQNVEEQIGSERANGGTRADRPMKAVQRERHKWVSGWQGGEGSHSTLEHNQVRGPKDEDRADQGLRDSTKFGRGAGWRKQDAGAQVKGDRMSGFNERWDRKLADAGEGIKNNDSFDEAMALMPIDRNMRTVWTMPTEPFKGAHFATFPRELARRCILAGCPPGGIVFDPFMGSGTVAEVAMSLGRRYIGCELNPESAAMLKTLRSGQVGLQL